ncbi:M20 family metallopeptidase [Aerococcaceae bacterium NML191292]|nr:M20 family metallopeptidase [Aerococcaceae bacterium NML191292]MCW6674703.1 M20 family metallopeptidase [Aerococcaceae bacterium NML171108]MCW6676640.1 M20 family metallopeptidase [Aerococcaceae bacterium NML180378]
MTEQYINSIQTAIKKRLATYQALALDIHDHPEVSNYEFHAMAVLSQQLEKEGFAVERDVAGHRTGFDARYTSDKPGPTFAFLAEYDALAGIGHACGHNLFGNYSLLAAAALKQVVDQLGGELRVYGTPGEEGGENGSAKGSFVREGYFDDVDVALCAHPGYRYTPTLEYLANDPVDIKFYGRASHAAGAPEDGINALEAVIQVYNSINALRLHLPKDVNIHGIITHGGEAANVIPEFASARFYLRAANRQTLNTVYRKVENIVKAAALATGCTYEFGLFQNAVDNVIPTPLFDEVFFRQVEAIGIPETEIERRARNSLGSSDVGNVSQVIPTIQPTVSISDEYIAGHSEEFKAAARSQKGLDSIGIVAELLARTTLELLLQPKLLDNIKQQHQQLIKE